jgi:hypothetical protein
MLLSECAALYGPVGLPNNQQLQAILQAVNGLAMKFDSLELKIDAVEENVRIIQQNQQSGGEMQLLHKTVST